jgi:hypothetical protein
VRLRCFREGAKRGKENREGIIEGTSKGRSLVGEEEKNVVA